MMAAVAEVVDVDVRRDEGVVITWDDGLVAAFANRDLRAACPCAGCRTTREGGQLPRFPDDVTVADARLVGAWGLGITWSDGHATGIYPWEGLRAWEEDRRG